MLAFNAALLKKITPKRRPLKNLLLALCLSSALSPAFASSNLTSVTLAAENSWPPFSKADGTGLSNQIIGEAYKSQGIDVKYVVAPYARQLIATQNGTYVGAFNVTKEPSTERKLMFCNERLFKATTAYYINEDSPLNASRYQDLKAGHRVGLIIGYEYGPYILTNNHLEKHLVSNQTALVKMLLAGRLDSIIMFDAIAQYILPTIANGDKIKRAFDGQHSDIYVAFSKRHKDAPYFCEKLDKGLKLLKENGRLQAILGDQAVP